MQQEQGQQGFRLWDGSQWCCEADSELLGPVLHHQGSHVSWNLPASALPLPGLSHPWRFHPGRSSLKHKQLLLRENGISRPNLNYLCLFSLWNYLFSVVRTCSGGTISPKLFLMGGTHLISLESKWDVQIFFLLPCLNPKLFLQ